MISNDSMFFLVCKHAAPRPRRKPPEEGWVEGDGAAVLQQGLPGDA